MITAQTKKYLITRANSSDEYTHGCEYCIAEVLHLQIAISRWRDKINELFKDPDLSYIAIRAPYKFDMYYENDILDDLMKDNDCVFMDFTQEEIDKFIAIDNKLILPRIKFFDPRYFTMSLIDKYTDTEFYSEEL